MRILILFMVTGLLQVHAAAVSQTITLTVKNQPLDQVLKALKQQTGYAVFSNKSILKKAQPVSISAVDMPVTQFLEAVFKNQPVSFEVVRESVVIKEKEGSILPDRHPERSETESNGSHQQPKTITGIVTDSARIPLPNVTVRIKGSNQATVTDRSGKFTLSGVPDDATLSFTLLGYEPQEISSTYEDNLTIMLNLSASVLDETVVIAYGTTTQRLNTGSVGRVTAAEISNQPVSNPLAAMSGRIPGVIVTQTTGVPGGSFNVQIRGRNSIDQGTEPFFIIDGVPFAPNNENINGLANAASNMTYGITSGLSPLNFINPAEIASIEVLKDADATAIYGSRAANGVVLITTKKGQSGSTSIQANIYTGASAVSRRMELLSTSDYIAMRKEAFANDGVTMTNANAYDILVWDTTRYTDWQKKLTGGTATTTDVQASISGGNTNTQFLIGGNFHKESTVYPGDFSNSRKGLRFNINHQVLNRLTINLNGSYSTNVNKLPQGDITGDVLSLIPHFPEPYDDAGKLQWSNGGYSFDNPLAVLERPYHGSFDNLISNMTLEYKIISGLAGKVNLGFNSVRTDEDSSQPSYAFNPIFNLTGTASFITSNIKALIVEPQIRYGKTIGMGRFDAFIGFAYQHNSSQRNSLTGQGYSNDALLGSISGATTIRATTTNSLYKYAAVFGRINYDLNNTYLFNITARRDGSSRFGPGRQYANFGAIGAGWIFSNYQHIKTVLPFLSFGKLRASFGTSGNDAIGNYQYLDVYSSTTNAYQGISGLYPTDLFNPDYGWETNRKFEAALELGFLKDRILISGGWFLNKSGNQLVQYILPTQTGFSGITQNLPAVIENSGTEIQLSSDNINNRNFSWKTSFNITFAKNKLISFPDLATSSYRNSYLIGKSLNIARGFNLKEVNSETGLYTFIKKDRSETNLAISPDDLLLGIANRDPKFYGGLNNSFRYSGFQLEVFLEFRKQTGYSYQRGISAPPGSMYNQPKEVTGRWKELGDETTVQRYTTTVSSPAYQAYLSIGNNGASSLYTDASFIRLKNLSFSYELKGSWVESLALSTFRLYVQGQNLFLITNYRGVDPESQLFSRLPPLRTITTGIQIIL